ncbi:hypothetical protein METHB2_790015 [Candidatus Methylobacter favarea]|uniref:Uncharacterized protein n=1 Tax=Candidatus Methylobacter favarea TaxID=2707345 RepID=A0A8S0WSE9_9GAMM|nr:hypothetical protein [Candidatus Methylobacter favarea]CAA9892681.1 hypothetical protein METHB2_790015 [Candidatus Methylobacter favarea]
MSGEIIADEAIAKLLKEGPSWATLFLKDFAIYHLIHALRGGDPLSRQADP